MDPPPHPFCVQRILFSSSRSLPLLHSSLHPAYLGASSPPLPYWLCEVQRVERGTSNGKAMGSIPTKFQTFTELSLWDNLSARLPYWIHWCILLCNWCSSVSSVTAGFHVQGKHCRALRSWNHLHVKNMCTHFLLPDWGWALCFVRNLVHLPSLFSVRRFYSLIFGAANALAEAILNMSDELHKPQCS